MQIGSHISDRGAGVLGVAKGGGGGAPREKEREGSDALAADARPHPHTHTHTRAAAAAASACMARSAGKDKKPFQKLCVLSFDSARIQYTLVSRKILFKSHVYR